MKMIDLANLTKTINIPYINEQNYFRKSVYIPKFEVRLNFKSFLLRYDQLQSSNVVKSRMSTQFQNPTGV